MEIPNRKDQVLCLKAIPLVKVLLQNHLEEKATWEREDEIKEKYPQLFQT